MIESQVGVVRMHTYAYAQHMHLQTKNIAYIKQLNKSKCKKCQLEILPSANKIDRGNCIRNKTIDIWRGESKSMSKKCK